MKVADEPAYLTVGTDVSAKYRGAFCEAKIKTVKRMVKVKVVLKGESTSQVVQDDQVKGPLRVGSTVEVKSPEGAFSEAVISKLTDASWYTVVFDDGDEKTLRRTSLCLKGERHFAESETLDQLPLTNPEHFGTPVIGKKTNRGRRSSQAVADEEKESSSSEEEDDDRRRLNDDLLGKVVGVQTGLDRVISPSCNDDLAVKKDQCLVRSFADSKFHTVARTEIYEITLDTISRADCSSKKGFEEALLFLQTKQVPDGWKMDMSEILESSSSDDGDGKESEEEEKEPEPEEPDDEPDPEERDHFLQQLYKFMEDRGTPINKPPVLGYKDLNLFKLFRLVHQHGGCDSIESGSVWKQVYMDLGIPVLNSAASYNVKTAYRKYLYGFEEYCRSAQIQFRTVHHNDPRPVEEEEEEEREVGEDKGDLSLQASAEAEPSTEKTDGDESEHEAEEERGLRDVCSPRGRRRCTVTPVKTEVKEPVRQERVKEEARGGEGSGEEQKEKLDGDHPGKRRSRRPEESDKDSEEEELEEEEDEEEESERPRLREREEREGEEGYEESEHSVTGTKVKVKYGKGKTQKIYEANIKNTETDDGEVLYLVHYYGWNVRYDEWVKADRIIWPVDKGGTKKKQKKKVKNKDDVEKEDDKQAKMAVKRGRPPLKSTPPVVSRSVSKTPSGEGRPGSKSSRLSDPSSLPNGDGTPRRRTRRTSGMYDSDRASNDSGNSSEESEGEDSPEKKPEWVELTDPATARKQEEEEERLEEESRAEAAQAHPQPACPSSPREKPQEGSEAEKLEEEPAVLLEPEDKSPKSRTKRARARDPGSEPSTQLPATPGPAEPEMPCALLRLAKKPPEPGHSSPDAADSDTDSATEDIGPPERSCLAKRKAPEHRTPDKKVRLDRKEEPKASSPEKRPDAEGRTGAVEEPEEPPVPAARAVAPAEEPEVKTEMPALTREVQIRVEPLPDLGMMKEDASAGTDDELMPQIGPEALVCHEVDLDDPEEKEKPAGEEFPALREEQALALTPAAAPMPPLQTSSAHLPLSLPGAGPPRLCSPASAPSPDESHSTRSESDATVEVDSVAESQEGLAESGSPHGFDASASSSTSSISLQERDGKDRGQKRLLDCNVNSPAKKPKRNQKRLSTAASAEKNGAGHSSDSEDLPVMDTASKLTPVKHSSMAKPQKLSRSPGLASPSSKDLEKDKHKEKQSFPSPRTYKWTFQLNELDNMSSAERISFLQDKLQEIRKYYMSLKSEVASIDRRRKRLKKKEREVSHTTASTSSGSSDTGMSPSSASPTQNTVAVECR
uniref:ARID domain-containing protein n=1 Tax=Electrophorus electricus TaxID=8005 RepID=A0A4W4GY33_ELEEL